MAPPLHKSSGKQGLGLGGGGWGGVTGRLRGMSAFGVLRRCWGQCSLGAGQESFSEGGGV